MVEPFISTPIMADKAESPLGSTGLQKHGDSAALAIIERTGLAICDVAAWPESAQKAANAICKATGLILNADGCGLGPQAQAFTHAPDRWTVISTDQAMTAGLHQTMANNGTVVDLSHGRVVFRVAGTRMPWVLSKLFAIDFSLAALPIGKGLATQHHEIFAQIQRIDDVTCDIIVFRSYARAFCHNLKVASVA